MPTPDTTVAPPSPQTAEAINRPQTGASTLTPATPVSQATLTQQVNRAQGAKAPVPAGLVSKCADDILSPWMRLYLYGETDAWKTTTAAEAGSKDDVRIIATRGEDQLLPLRGSGYKYVICDNTAKFRYSCLYPEQIWPEWAGRANRILVIDDITAAKDLLLEDNETDDQGRERRDMRMVHREAKSDMGDLMRSMSAKQMHVIVVALAQIYTNDITREETITLDVPPAMNRMLTTDASFVFFLDRSKRMMLTTSKRETYRKKNDKGVEETFTRSVFAKHKLPKALEGKGIIKEYEPIGLADLWKRIQESKVGK